MIFIRTVWGYNLLSNLSKNIVLDKEIGYKGYEIAWSFTNKQDYKRIGEELILQNMKLIVQLHTSGQNLNEHIDSYKYQVDEILSTGNKKPDLINCHSGCDFWSLDQKRKFYESINLTELISHETHRGRILNSPKDYYDLMDLDIPTTLDLSHWVVSYERLLNEQNLPFFEKILYKLQKNTRLIHGRISTTNNIQITNLDPYYLEFQNYYLNIWKRIASRSSNMMMTLEYGPEPYSNSPEQAEYYQNREIHKKLIDIYNSHIV